MVIMRRGSSRDKTLSNIAKIRKASFAVAFASLSIVLHIYKYPYPLYPALSFDLAGVPLAIAMLYSIDTGFLSSLIFYLGALMLTTDPTRVIGPSMKVLAELSTSIPFALVYRSMLSKSANENKAWLVSFVVAFTCRVGIMTLANYVISPHWMIWARWAESYEFAYKATLMMLPHVALFNAIVVLYVVPLAIAVWKSIRRYMHM